MKRLSEEEYISIFPKKYGISTFLHTTSEERAELICKYGFLVGENFSKTVDEVSINTIDFWHSYRRVYGSHAVVIQFNWDRFYSDEFKDKKKIAKVVKKLSKIDDSVLESEFEMLIPPEFIIGYMTDGEFIKCD